MDVCGEGSHRSGVGREIGGGVVIVVFGWDRITISNDCQLSLPLYLLHYLDKSIYVYVSIAIVLQTISIFVLKL